MYKLQNIHIILIFAFEIFSTCSAFTITPEFNIKVNKTNTGRNIDFDENSTEANDAAYFMEEKITDYVDSFDSNEDLDEKEASIILTVPSSSTPLTADFSDGGEPGSVLSFLTTSTKKEYRSKKFTTPPVDDGVYKRICVYPNWSILRDSVLARIYPEDIDPFLCTHIHFAYANIDIRTFQLMPSQFEDNHNGTHGLVIFDLTFNFIHYHHHKVLFKLFFYKALYERINKLRELNPDLKVLISVGGWFAKSTPFNLILADDTTRGVFIENVVKFLREWDFDGLGNFLNPWINALQYAII
jgi:hypothetical protein